MSAPSTEERSRWVRFWPNQTFPALTFMSISTVRFSPSTMTDMCFILLDVYYKVAPYS